MDEYKVYPWYPYDADKPYTTLPPLTLKKLNRVMEIDKQHRYPGVTGDLYQLRMGKSQPQPQPQQQPSLPRPPTIKSSIEARKRYELYSYVTAGTIIHPPGGPLTISDVLSIITPQPQQPPQPSYLLLPTPRPYPLFRIHHQHVVYDTDVPIMVTEYDRARRYIKETEINDQPKPETYTSFKNRFTEMFPEFNDLDWYGIAIAGGAISSTLFHIEMKDDQDLDMFFYGLSEDEITAKIEYIIEHIKGHVRRMRENMSEVEYHYVRFSELQVYRSCNCVTIIYCAKPHDGRWYGRRHKARQSSIRDITWVRSRILGILIRRQQCIYNIGRQTSSTISIELFRYQLIQNQLHTPYP